MTRSYGQSLICYSVNVGHVPIHSVRLQSDRQLVPRLRDNLMSTHGIVGLKSNDDPITGGQIERKPLKSVGVPVAK